MKRMNSILSIVLCIAIILTIATYTVGAQSVIISGDWSYTKINNNREYQIEEYLGDDSDVVIYKYYNMLSITSIGSYAFSANEVVKNLKLGSAIKCIKALAFSGASLETIELNAKLESIEYNAFIGCSSLNSINLEDTRIDSVPYSCFYGCGSLTEITLPETVTMIGENAFAYCDSLSKIMIPASVTEIADNAFYSTPNVVIHCYRDSVAHVYAETNSIEYVLIDPEPTVPETQPTEPTVPETQPTEPPRTYMLGDIDDDGEITVMDATRIQLILVELYKNYTEEDVIRGDVEKDGVLSIMDVTSIQRYSASFDDGLGIGETFEF